jgi:hypothetical protein
MARLHGTNPPGFHDITYKKEEMRYGQKKKAASKR